MSRRLACGWRSRLLSILFGSRAVGLGTASYWKRHAFRRVEAMRQLGFAPDVILDVGASDGSWTRDCMSVFPAAAYYCIDPLVEHEPGLVALNRENARVKYRLCLIGAQPGKMVLNVDGHGSSVLRGHWDNPYGQQREVIMQTLDGLLEEGWLVPPQLLKVDVQGYELEVLKGGARTLSSVEAIIAEVSFFRFQAGMPVFHELVESLRRQGFVCYDVLSLSPRPLDGALAQADLLFVREDSQLRASNQWDKDSVY